MTKQSAYETIGVLVDRFHEQRESYKKKDYNETLARRDFIDPFFKALGWDIDNAQGYAEAYREVIHEDKIKIGSATKAPDYSFRLPGGKRLFFVEAKKPSVAVKTEILPAYQVRRYAWSAKLPVSILTDFEEFAVYDCNKKPLPTDKASTGRIKYLTYADYLNEFDFLWDAFSKERVLKGSFDKYIASDSGKRGTSSVDKDFLHSLDGWRVQLAENIALRNPGFGEDELNFTVQQTLDRLIFLRIAEDRGVEEYARLQKTTKAPDVYAALFSQFQEADEKYNSGLFNFKQDKLSAALRIDNKTLKGIVGQLYYPESPYEFSVLPVEILGSAYEQFLGKQIKLNARHKAEVEEKPEVRKAGGVYYTPQYIVDYIVKQTVGKLVEGKKPDAVAKLKIVDPACGSGSFLIGAYNFLLQWHLTHYTPRFKELSEVAGSTDYNSKQRADAIKERSKLPLTPDGALATSLKKQILLNNIYGVDIDVQAVEVTKLSLLLKCMEGETSSSIYAEMRFGERVLPTLDGNIKSGNSLIDLDFYDGEFDYEPGAEKKIKPFSWKQAFSDVFKSGGFDAVIGNPPYLGGREWKEANGNQYQYFIEKYKVANYQFDIYNLFIEKGIKLLKKNGLLGYITPNTWLNNQSTEGLRKFILNRSSIKQIVDYSSVKVFSHAVVLPIVFVVQNNTGVNNTEVIEPHENGFKIKLVVDQAEWEGNEFSIININSNAASIALIKKIESRKTTSLELLAIVKFGIKIYETGKGEPKQKPDDAKNKIFESTRKIDKTYRPYLEGKDVFPCEIRYANRWLKYGKNLAAPRDPHLFEGNRLLVRRIVGKTLLATYTNEDYVTSQLLQIVKPVEPSDSKYLLGIINSKLIAFYFKKKYNREDKVFPEIRIYELAQLPIKICDTNSLKQNAEELKKLVICCCCLISKKLQPHCRSNSKVSNNALHTPMKKLINWFTSFTDYLMKR